MWNQFTNSCTSYSGTLDWSTCIGYWTDLNMQSYQILVDLRVVPWPYKTKLRPCLLCMLTCISIHRMVHDGIGDEWSMHLCSYVDRSQAQLVLHHLYVGIYLANLMYFWLGQAWASPTLVWLCCRARKYFALPRPLAWPHPHFVMFAKNLGRGLAPQPPLIYTFANIYIDGSRAIHKWYS